MALLAGIIFNARKFRHRRHFSETAVGKMPTSASDATGTMKSDISFRKCKKLRHRRDTQTAAIKGTLAVCAMSVSDRDHALLSLQNLLSMLSP